MTDDSGTPAYDEAKDDSGVPPVADYRVAQVAPAAYEVVAGPPDNPPEGSNYGISNLQPAQMHTPDAGDNSQLSRPKGGAVARAVPSPCPGRSAGYSEARQPRHLAQPGDNQLAPAMQRTVPTQQPGVYKALDPEDMTWLSSRGRAQSKASAAVQQVRTYDKLHIYNRTGMSKNPLYWSSSSNAASGANG